MKHQYDFVSDFSSICILQDGREFITFGDDVSVYEAERIFNIISNQEMIMSNILGHEEEGDTN
jgi:hypothetical protein